MKMGKIDGVKPDATFVMLDNDFVNLSQGKLKPQEAFMQVSSKQSNNMDIGKNENQRKYEGSS